MWSVRALPKFTNLRRVGHPGQMEVDGGGQ